MPNGISHRYQLDESISNLGVVVSILILRVYVTRVSAYGICFLCLSLLVLHMKCKDYIKLGKSVKIIVKTHQSLI